MSETIAVSPEAMEERFAHVLPRVDEIDSALGRIPDAPDGGLATELIGFVMAAAAEAGRIAADSYRALIAIAGDVMNDLAENDSAAAEELRALRDQVEASL